MTSGAWIPADEAGPTDDFLDAVLGEASRLAREAGALLRDRLNAPRDVQHKGRIDLVTDADRASETLIRAALRSTFPEHRLLGEEGGFGSHGTDIAARPFGWIIDPLDGTTNYAHRYPHFAVSIGLEWRGVPVVGAVYDPMRDELFAARSGGGATLNGAPLHISATPTVGQSLLATGFSYDLDQRTEGTALWEEMNARAQGLRRDGAAALNLCWVAAGRLDGYAERPVQPWDIAAGIVIVREAAGIVTGFGVGPPDVYGHEIVATNGLIHDELRGLIDIVVRRVGATA